MEEEVFNDPEVMQQLQKEFYIVKINKESGNYPDFIHPKYFPTTYVFDPVTLKIIDSLAGYREKEKFLKFFHETYEIETQEDPDI
jgi:thioredoxin-related protein